MARKHTLGLMLSVALLWPAVARSNDSSAEVGIGGSERVNESETAGLGS